MLTREGRATTLGRQPTLPHGLPFRLQKPSRAAAVRRRGAHERGAARATRPRRRGRPRGGRLPRRSGSTVPEARCARRRRAEQLGGNAPRGISVDGFAFVDPEQEAVARAGRANGATHNTATEVDDIEAPAVRRAAGAAGVRRGHKPRCFAPRPSSASCSRGDQRHPHGGLGQPPLPSASPPAHPASPCSDAAKAAVHSGGGCVFERRRGDAAVRELGARRSRSTSELLASGLVANSGDAVAFADAVFDDGRAAATTCRAALAARPRAAPVLGARAPREPRPEFATTGPRCCW